MALGLAGGLLAGCEITQQYGAECTTSPPVPHHNFGVVDITADVPPKVVAGSTFAIRVEYMVGYPAPGQPGTFPEGVLEVTGPVEPSGRFGVGQGVFGGEPYPNTLEFTVTGQPGDEIEIVAVSGSSLFGQIPNAFLATCFANAHFVTIPVVALPS